jgi:hypothetical protein
MMAGLGYPFCNVLEAARAHAALGTVEGCPVVEPGHVGQIDQAAGADERRAFELGSDPADWPDWTDAHTWEIGPEPAPGDRSWWAREGNQGATDYEVLPRPRRGARSLAPHTDAEIARDPGLFGSAV